AAAQRLGLGEVRLKLDRVGARFGRGVEEIRGQSDVAVMVDARFGDDEAGLARTNRAGSDLDAPVVWHQVLTLALFSLRCSRPEITEQTELTAKHGETKKGRPKDAVRRLTLPVCLGASTFLCASGFGRCLHILRVLAPQVPSEGFRTS